MAKSHTMKHVLKSLYLIHKLFENRVLHVPHGAHLLKESD